MRFWKAILVLTALIPALGLQSEGQVAVSVAGPPEILVDQPGIFALAPMWSPNAEQPRLAFTTRNYRGLWVKDLNYATAVMLSDERAAGFGFRWSKDGTAIAARVASFEGVRRRDAIKVFVPDDAAVYELTAGDARIRTLPEWTDSGDALIVQSERRSKRLDTPPDQFGNPSAPKRPTDAFVVRDNLILRVHPDASEETVAQFEGDVLNLSVSPDRAWLAFEILGGDLYLSRTDGSSQISLGRGNRPAWSPDSDRIVFMRTVDDGHNIISSELLVGSTSGNISVLTNTPEILEMNPSWSPFGDRIAYDFDGRIYALPLAVQR